MSSEPIRSRVVSVDTEKIEVKAIEGFQKDQFFVLDPRDDVTVNQFLRILVYPGGKAVWYEET